MSRIILFLSVVIFNQFHYDWFVFVLFINLILGIAFSLPFLKNYF